MTPPSGKAWRNLALGPRSPFALRFLATLTSAGLLFVLLAFAALQGMLAGGRFWPFWLVLLLAGWAFLAALAGRLRQIPWLLLAALLLAAGLVLAGVFR